MSPVPPLKIIHVVASPNGAPWMIAVMREQKRLGHDVAAIIPSRDGNITAQLDALGIPTYAATVDVLFTLPLVRKPFALLRLVRLLRRLRPDVVHSHVVNSVVTARLASWLADVPMHLGANCHPFSMESDILRPIEVGTAFCDAATIASCVHTRDLMLRHGIPEQQVSLIYYAVDQSGHDPALTDASRLRRELGIAPETPVIGKVAYFYPPTKTAGFFPDHVRGRGVKGHDVLIRAVPHVLEHFPDAKFVLIGRGWGVGGEEYEQELKELARSVAAEESILFPGERRDIPDVLAAFDVSVHCSLSDNLAGTVEALLMAKPLVVSDIPGFADTVQHEKTGLVVPADDSIALAEAITRLLRDRAFAAQLGENGRRATLERFTLARTVADLEELVQRLRHHVPGRYRLGVSLARAIALPFRLLPVTIAAYRGRRLHGFSLRRYVWQRILNTLSRARRLASPLKHYFLRRTRAGTPKATTSSGM